MKFVAKITFARGLLKAKLDQSFKLTHDLVVHLDETSPNLDLPSQPSNRIAGQLWCIVGARQSCTKAIEMGGWKGFSCSLTTPCVKQSVLAVLEARHKRMNEIDFADLTDAQIELAFDLLEHEIQHHGQPIRFVYGNGLTFPDSWNKRYSVGKETLVFVANIRYALGTMQQTIGATDKQITHSENGNIPSFA